MLVFFFVWQDVYQFVDDVEYDFVGIVVDGYQVGVVVGVGDWVVLYEVYVVLVLQVGVVDFVVEVVGFEFGYGSQVCYVFVFYVQFGGLVDQGVQCFDFGYYFGYVEVDDLVVDQWLVEGFVFFVIFDGDVDVVFQVFDYVGCVEQLFFLELQYLYYEVGVFCVDVVVLWYVDVIEEYLGGF